VAELQDIKRAVTDSPLMRRAPALKRDILAALEHAKKLDEGLDRLAVALREQIGGERLACERWTQDGVNCGSCWGCRVRAALADGSPGTDNHDERTFGPGEFTVAEMLAWLGSDTNALSDTDMGAALRAVLEERRRG